MRAYIFDIYLNKNDVIEYNEEECRKNCIERFIGDDFEYWLNEADSVDDLLFRIFY